MTKNLLSAVSRTLISLALAVPVSVAISGGGPLAMAQDKCSPDIKVINSHDATTSIKVTKLQYRIDGTSVWNTESVTNKVIGTHNSYTYKSQLLGSAGKGEKLDWRVQFAPDTGRGYGAEQPSNVTGTSTSCENNVTYTVTVQ